MIKVWRTGLSVIFFIGFLVLLANHASFAGQNPILFTTPGCHWCELVRTDLKNHCIRFKETSNISQLQTHSVPQLEVNGQYLIGYDAIESFISNNSRC